MTVAKVTQNRVATPQHWLYCLAVPLQMQPEFSVRLLDSSYGAANQVMQRIKEVIEVGPATV